MGGWVGGWVGGKERREEGSLDCLGLLYCGWCISTHLPNHPTKPTHPPTHTYIQAPSFLPRLRLLALLDEDEVVDREEGRRLQVGGWVGGWETSLF